MAKSKTKKRKNSDYKASSVTPVAEKKPEKKSTLARAQDRAEKRQKNKNKPKEKREKGRWKEYFRGVKLEMRKVVWPTKPELGSYTAVVLAVCAAFALLFWGIDSAVLAGIKAICF
jgi:preprotein translocase subunit SecE